jgi:hypothetical protein
MATGGSEKPFSFERTECVAKDQPISLSWIRAMTAPRQGGLERAYPMVYEMVYGRVAEAGASEVVDFGEPPGTRTQGPRLKSSLSRSTLAA